MYNIYKVNRGTGVETLLYPQSIKELQSAKALRKHLASKLSDHFEVVIRPTQVETEVYAYVYDDIGMFKGVFSLIEAYQLVEAKDYTLSLVKL